MSTLLVTIDSLRHDEYMPRTSDRIDAWHSNAWATAPNTIGSMPAVMSGKLRTDAGVDRTIADHIDEEYSVGITTNHLLSPAYGYDSGFDYFEAPSASDSSLANRIGRRLPTGSRTYRIAARAYELLQRVLLFSEPSKSFRPADDAIDEFLNEIGETDTESWFGWIHLMEPHYPYDPDTANSRRKAQTISRRVVNGGGSVSDKTLARQYYKSEILGVDRALERLWNTIPDDTTVIVTADHGELLGEDGTWGHPVETDRNEVYRVPFGYENLPAEPGEYVSLVDVPSLLVGESIGDGRIGRMNPPDEAQNQVPLSEGTLEDLEALGYT